MDLIASILRRGYKRKLQSFFIGGRAEVEQDKELIFPLVNNMFSNREQGVKELNEKFGLNVSVDYGSVWKDRRVDNESESESESMENENRNVEFSESTESN